MVQAQGIAPCSRPLQGRANLSQLGEQSGCSAWTRTGIVRQSSAYVRYKLTRSALSYGTEVVRCPGLEPGKAKFVASPAIHRAPELAPRLRIELSVPALEVLAARQRPRDEMAESEWS